MSITINKSDCIGCKQCVEICPGNLIRIDTTKKAYIKNFSDCWHCMACIKECPVNAISLIIPPEMEGKGGRLTIKRSGNYTEWTIHKADGTKINLVTNTEEANKY